jgi:HEAT repeat protein
VVRQLWEIRRLASNRSRATRWAAARALGEGNVGADVLRERLRVEKVPAILAEVCDSLGRMGDRATLPKLRTLGARHPSAVVRCHALMAIVDIAGEGAAAFLRKRHAEEKEIRTRATIQCLLNWLGREAAVDQLVRALSSRRIATRQAIANLCAQYPPRSNRSAVVAAMKSLEGRMPPIGARSDVRKAISVLQGAGEKGPARVSNNRGQAKELAR